MLRVQQYQQLILPVLKRYMVKHAAIFGSVAKGESHPDSDIDLLIEPGKDFTIFKMLALEEEITALLNCKVDLVEYGALKPSIKEEVMRSAITIL
jgi:predicted nucleotidyltransferase